MCSICVVSLKFLTFFNDYLKIGKVIKKPTNVDISTSVSFFGY